MGRAAIESPPAATLGGLLGREHDLESLARALEASRLVTLTGAPGIGKTRLALAVVDDHPEPSAVVELATIADPALIPSALATALSIQEAPGHSLIEAILASLLRRRLLLVLDNCEHLLDACAETTVQMLEACPQVHILATSREPLGTNEEVVWPVPPLAVPDADETRPEVLLGYPAVALFAKRASAVRSEFTLNASMVLDATDICRRLDGIPLAIELAAARVGTMTVGEISRRLEAHVGLLSEHALGSAPRHRTLSSALEWSYSLLGDEERAVLRCLSVFAGTFEMEAATAICSFQEVTASDIPDILERLASKSLLVPNADPAQPGRYRLLETVRAYAAERLDRADLVAEVRTRHASFYTALAERAEPEFTGPRQLEWFERIAAERANLRAATEWSLSRGDSGSALRLTGALVLFWRVRGPYTEGRELLRAALAAGAGQQPEVRGKALWGAGFLTLMSGEARVAVPLLEESLGCFRGLGDPQGCARALLILANAYHYGSVERSVALVSESIRFAREANDHWCLAHGLGLVGFDASWRREDVEEARAAFRECLAVARNAGDMQGIRFGLIGLGESAVDTGDFEEAERWLTEAVSVTSALGEAYDQAVAQTFLGELALGRGDLPSARELLEGAIRLTPEIAPPNSLFHALELLARVAYSDGDRVQAEALLKELSSSSVRNTRFVLSLGRMALTDGDLSRARGLFEEALAANVTCEKRRSAAVLHELALLARREGAAGRAADLHEKALAVQREMRLLPAISNTLEAVAGLLASAGHLEHGARLMGAARGMRNRGGYARPSWESPRVDSDLDLLRQSMDSERFESALAAGEGLSLDHAVGAAFDLLRPVDPTCGSWPSLTDREVEIAELVAKGMTTAEIAERFVICQQTVRTHISHIYAKLGVSGRTMLAGAVAARSNARGTPPSVPRVVASSPQSEARAYELLEALRWPDGEPVCPHCGSVRRHYFLTRRSDDSRRTRTGSVSQRRLWKCADCRKPFSVLTGTILHGSKVAVRTWLLVVGQMACSETGLSSRQIEREYGLTPKTASSMIDRIREAMVREPMVRLLSGREPVGTSSLGVFERAGG